MGSYTYVTTRAQDAILARVLARSRAPGGPTTIDQLIATRINDLIASLASEQAALDLTRITTVFSRAPLEGREQILTAAEAAKNLPP